MLPSPMHVQLSRWPLCCCTRLSSPGSSGGRAFASRASALPSGATGRLLAAEAAACLSASCSRAASRCRPSSASRPCRAHTTILHAHASLCMYRHHDIACSGRAATRDGRRSAGLAPAAWPGWQRLRRCGWRGRHLQPPEPPGVRAAVPASQLPAPPPVVAFAKTSKPAEWEQKAPALQVDTAAPVILDELHVCLASTAPSRDSNGLTAPDARQPGFATEQALPKSAGQQRGSQQTAAAGLPQQRLHPSPAWKRLPVPNVVVDSETHAFLGLGKQSSNLKKVCMLFTKHTQGEQQLTELFSEPCSELEAPVQCMLSCLQEGQVLGLDRRAPLLPGHSRALPAQPLERRSSRLELLNLAHACVLLHCTSRCHWYVHATLNEATCGAERHHDN